MKITKEHYTTLKAAILALPTQQVLTHYKELKAAGHTDRRFYFDVLYAADKEFKQHSEAKTSLITEIYKYANDDHLYTALKRILQWYIAEHSVILES